MNPRIFREYDIRGVYPDDLGPETVHDIGRALGTEALTRHGGSATRAVVHDCRLSSPTLRDALIAGLVPTGSHVAYVVDAPTPLLYFAVHDLDLDGGVQITGSHNPPEYNGFKMLLGKDALHGKDIEALRDRIEHNQLVQGSGSVRTHPIMDRYLDWVTQNIEM